MAAIPTLVIRNVGNGYARVDSQSGVPGATSYKLYRGTSPGGEALRVSGISLPYFDAVTSGTKYYYTLVSTDGGGDSAQSAEVGVQAATTLAWGSPTHAERHARKFLKYPPRTRRFT